jgi:hypothetical protein
MRKSITAANAGFHHGDPRGRCGESGVPATERQVDPGRSAKIPSAIRLQS